MIVDGDTDASQGYRERIGAQSLTRSILTLEGFGARLSFPGQMNQSLRFANILVDDGLTMSTDRYWLRKEYW